MSQVDLNDLQQLLLDTFILEAQEQLAALGGQLAMDQPDLEQCRRIAHTLKGSSRAVGLRSVERAAWGLEQYYRDQLENQPPSIGPEQISTWVSRIGYWSEDSHAKALFKDRPVALMWSSDASQSALYGSLLSREGYLVASTDSLEELAAIMDAHLPPALLCLVDSGQSMDTRALWLISEHPHWQHAPVLLFAAEIPSDLSMDIHRPAAQLAPGALLAGLETIREATA